MPHRSRQALLAPGVRTLAPYVPGKPLEELEREYGISDSIKLASNENPLGPGPRALEAIAQASRRDRPVSGRQRLQAEAGARAQARLRHRVHHARQRLERRARDDRGSVPDAAERSGLLAVRVRGLSDRRAGDRCDGARRAGESRRPRHAARSRSGRDGAAHQRAHAPGVRRQSEQSDRHVGRAPTRCGASSQRVPEQHAGGRRRGVHRIRRASRTFPTRAAGSASFRT